MGFPGGSDGKESACNARDAGLIPGLGRSPGEGNGYPLQYSCLENPMGRGAWWAAIYGVAQSRTQLKRLSSSSSICISEVIDISPSNPDSSCASSSSAFHMMYSAYKLNKQGDNIQPWRTPFPIWNHSVVPCPVLTCFLTCI